MPLIRRDTAVTTQCVWTRLNRGGRKGIIMLKLPEGVGAPRRSDLRWSTSWRRREIERRVLELNAECMQTLLPFCTWNAETGAIRVTRRR
jgi:hypothetical protein